MDSGCYAADDSTTHQHQCSDCIALVCVAVLVSRAFVLLLGGSIWHWVDFCFWGLIEGITEATIVMPWMDCPRSGLAISILDCLEGTSYTVSLFH